MKLKKDLPVHCENNSNEKEKGTNKIEVKNFLALVIHLYNKYAERKERKKKQPNSNACQ